MNNLKGTRPSSQEVEMPLAAWNLLIDKRPGLCSPHADRMCPQSAHLRGYLLKGDAWTVTGDICRRACAVWRRHLQNVVASTIKRRRHWPSHDWTPVLHH